MNMREMLSIRDPALVSLGGNVRKTKLVQRKHKTLGKRWLLLDLRESLERRQHKPESEAGGWGGSVLCSISMERSCRFEPRDRSETDVNVRDEYMQRMGFL